MMNTASSTWRICTVATVAGVLLGAFLLNMWTQSYRYRELADRRWEPTRDAAGYAGSVSCRECHERFYKLWSPSHHGRAMQPVTPRLVKESLEPLTEPIAVGDCRFSVDLDTRRMLEEKDGIQTSYPMLHAMGGKNVFFFLTPLDRGRLQVMPLAYDVRRREWFDTTRSMVRHFDDLPDSAVDWHDPLLTFNTACYNCHVSQLDKNYDAATDTYHTTWREPGINCEACHGPGQEHNRVCRAVPKGTVPRDLRTIRWGEFSHQQVNDACAPCHAKTRHIAPRFMPGDRFFDHYDLVCFEDRDFYPDGRDLGENYTHTGWLMNPCAKSGMLDCMHCHTSSGRFRQKDTPSTSCLPCHARRVRDISAHSRHQRKPKTPTCVSCHMPMTEFARMRRSDHSFRPPCPQASIKFSSPNACLLCHTGKTNEWAAGKVVEWHPRSHWCGKILREGTLVDAAREHDWNQLPDMLAYLQDAASEPVVVTSLIRLLGPCPTPEKWPPVRQCLEHASPLVRGAAADALVDDLDTMGTVNLLLDALSDDVRLVRVRAVAALARHPRETVAPKHADTLKRVEAELMNSFSAQPDAWSSHYNLGNYRCARGDLQGGLSAYDRAIALRSDVIIPYVNASVTASQLGRLTDSIRYLKKAYQVEPKHSAVNLNLGLALAEKGDTAGAEKHLRLAVKTPESRGQAAFNLAVLVAARDRKEAVRLCRLATRNAPDNPRYAYTLAYYLAQESDWSAAIGILDGLIAGHKEYVDAWALLGQCYLQARRREDAVRHYRAMRDERSLPANARQLAESQLRALDNE